MASLILSCLVLALGYKPYVIVVQATLFIQLRTSAVIVSQWVRSFSERGLYILVRMCERLFFFPSRLSTYISICHLIYPMRAAVLTSCLHDGSNY